MKLILMPGMDGTGELFAPLLQALGSSIESTVLRYPMHEPLGYSDLVLRVRAELPSSGPFVLLGESFSGPLAIMLAAEAPAGLRGVILSASFATNPMQWFPRFAWPLVQPVFFRAMPRFTQIKAVLGRYAKRQEAAPSSTKFIGTEAWTPVANRKFLIRLNPNGAASCRFATRGYLRLTLNQASQATIPDALKRAVFHAVLAPLPGSKSRSQGDALDCFRVSSGNEGRVGFCCRILFQSSPAGRNP